MTTELASSATLKQGLCVKMAVGSNVESIPDTATVHHQSSSCHNRDGEHCFGLPYEDHNYGAPPPPPPTPPLSPNTFSTHGLTGNCFDTINANNTNMCLKQAPDVKPQSYLATALPCKNGIVKMNDMTPTNVAFIQANGLPPDSNMAVGDITRCICGFSHDDGYMICCDRCSVWQHIDCMNIDRNNIPDTYLCDRCNPRVLNRQEAMQLQARKREDLLMVSELDSSDTESGDDKQRSKVMYTAVQSTPTSLTITSNRTGKKPEPLLVGKKRKRSRDDNKKANKKTHLADRKRSRSRSKSSCNYSVDDDNMGVTFTWARKLKEWNESYSEVDANRYTPELLQAILSSSYKSNDSVKQEESLLFHLRRQLAKVQQLRSRVMAMEDICVSKPVAEVLGSYMLSNQTEASNSGIIKRPYPFMFFYHGFDGLEVCVDARSCGNVSRYVRRSCCPNCEVRHVTEDNKLHLFIYSKENISSGSEITIPFDFKYQTCLYDVECGCGQFKDCPVYKFTNMRIEMEEKNGSKQHKNREDELGKVSPLRLSLARIHQHTNGYTNSDHEALNTAGEGEQDEQIHENQRKKSREDRKMEAYIRAFERMERQEKKKEQLHHSHSNPLDGKNTPHKNEVAPIRSPSMNNIMDSPQHNAPQSHQLSSEDALLTNNQTTVVPARRTNRRRSTRGGRRISRRGRGPSYEGVMSPSLSMETDSNHSCENATLTDTIASNSWLPPLTIEPSTESIFLPDNGTSFMLTDSISSVTEKSSPLANSPTVVTSATTGVIEADAALLETPSLLENTLVDSSHFQTENTKSEAVDLPEQNEVVMEKNIASDTESTPVTQTTAIILEAEVPTSASTTCTKPVKVKKTSSSVDTSTANSRSATPVGSGATQSSDVSQTSSFKHWDFRPGVPTGQVHIGVGSQSGRKYLLEKFMKKNWLDMAIDDDLVPPDTPKSCVTAESHVCGNFKKRFLKNYTSTKTTSGNEPATVSTDNLIENNTASDSITDEGTDDLKPATDAPVVSPVTAEADTRKAEVTDESSATGFPPLVTEQPNAMTSTSLQTLEYEIQSKVQSPLQPSDMWYGIPPRLNGELQANTLTHGMYAPQLALSYDSVYKAPFSEPAAPSSMQDDSQATPAKKKVSLQEYLKRSKESRKTVSHEQSPKSTSTSSASKSTIVTPPSSSDLKSICSTSLPNFPVLPAIPSLQSNTEMTTPVATTVPMSSSNLKKIDVIGSKDVDNFTKILKVVTKTQKGELENADLRNLANAFSPGIISSLSPQVMNIVNEVMRKFPATPEASSTKPGNSNNITKPSNVLTDSKKVADDKNTTSTPCDITESSTVMIPTVIRPHVERSNSSPNIRNPYRTNSNVSTPTQKKSSNSQQNSPSYRHSGSFNSGAYRKGFTSPVTASPRSSRGHSGSSLNSQSPSTPTIYDHRHRQEFSSSREHSGESTRSRHNSGASSETGSTMSSKSPRHAPSDSSSVHYNNKHSSNNNSGSVHSYKSDSNRSHEPPQKVPSLTPAVPGQPIPSLIRGLGGGRVPQPVYNRRPSPRSDSSSPRWDSHSSRDAPGRSLKDVTYARSDSFYHPPRPVSPNNPDYAYSRSSQDKSHHYDRYPPRSSRREDDHPPLKGNPPPGPYYHHYYQQGPPSYNDDRPGYYPPRDSRPPSPGPPPRHNSDYYSKSNMYRSNYYPPDIHRR